MVVGQVAFHRHAFQCIVIWLHSDCSYFWLFTYLVDGFVSYVGDTGEDPRLFVGDGEIAALIGDTAAEQRRVLGREQGNVGVCHGLSCLVDDGARQVAVGLVGAFHVDLALAVLCHSDGIEPHKLLYGVGDGCVVHCGRHAEVLQFVVDEDDVVGTGGRLDEPECV